MISSDEEILAHLNSLATTPISPKIEAMPDGGKWILTHYKLVHLWNMIDEKANLVIRKKLQDPFRTRRDKGYWKTFRVLAGKPMLLYSSRFRIPS